MRKSISSLFALLLLPLLAMAQFVTVPRNVYFADIHLVLSNGAQEEIQKKVDALHRNQTYFKMKVELADTYFPVIERVFREEGVPDDYKYLALQESGLIGDAVSTSNAVGYWQFKREAASDFNLRMDNRVDERRHIIEASRGAAKYFLRSNTYYNNWFNSLLSYYLGYSGAKTYTSPSDNGAHKMDVTEKSHPYVLTFLAHKIAYDAFVGKSNPPALTLREIRCTPGQSLADIAMATQTDYAELEKYNKWLLGGAVPSDKDYYVMVPVRAGGSDAGLLASKGNAIPAATNKRLGAAVRAKQNGLATVIARPGDTKDKLALQAGLSTRKFLKYNDLRSFDKIEPGDAYYTERKHSSAAVEYHVVQQGETMQQISQYYGIKLNYLLFKNRMNRNEAPVPGRVLWLQKRRPAHTPVEVRDLRQQKTAAADASAPAYHQPVATASTRQDISNTNREQEQEKPEDNIFKRFFDSFKRFKKDAPEPEKEEKDNVVLAEEEQPTMPAPAARTTTPVAVKSAATKAAAVQEAKEATADEEDDDAFMDPIVTEPAPAPTAPEPAPQKKKTVALYPQTDTASVLAAPAPKQPAAENAVDTLENTSPLPLEEAAPVAAAETTSAVADTAATIYTATDTTAAEAEENWVVGTPADEDSTATVKDIFVETAPAPAVTPARATPKPAPAATQPAPKPTRHIVKQGETLYGISRLYAVTVNDLTTWNHLGDEPLRMGQELYIAEPLAQPEESRATETAAESAYHTVSAGETLYQISKRYNVTLEDLRNWNDLTDNNIRLGQELRVQAPASTAAPTEQAQADVAPVPASGYHTVAAGESMYQISRQYGVTIKDIMQWNNKSDFSVSIGEKLKIRKK